MSTFIHARKKVPALVNSRGESRHKVSEVRFVVSAKPAVQCACNRGSMGALRGAP